ncbi:transcriptional factor [Lysobacteraceae bacterium NML08-0793]|nr:transcriptional factor [Xanthomonadaceae bacterium NML08-0793]
MLSRLGRDEKITAPQLHHYLVGEGYCVSIRTIERDLEKLSARFPLVCDDSSKPYHWSWSRYAEPLAIPGMSIRQAVVLLTAQTHLQALLPANLHDALTPLFAQASTTLRQRSQPGKTHWPGKVVQVSASQPLIAPEISQEVLLATHTALYEGQQLQIQYLRRGAEAARCHQVHPARLIQRGAVLYLAARIDGKPMLTLFALHRIQAAEILPRPATNATEAQLRDIMEEVSAGFSKGEPIELRLHMRRELAIHIEEAPLSYDQQSSPVDENWTEIIATVTNSAQLRWWLMGFGAGVKVKAPQHLAESITQMHREAAAS